MTLNDIAVKSDLNREEQAIFTEYTRNRFAGIKEITAPDSDFLAMWENIISFAKIFGTDKVINQKICPKRPVAFASPDTVDIRIYDSFAGKIPIISVRDTADFEQLVTNIAYKGIRPDSIEKTGASFISGKTTCFIILSDKPYSNVPASELGLSNEKDWCEKSLLLRQAHECTHYFTKQTYGISNNLLHDEIMADFIGMYEAFGFYKAEWFLKFLGIIEGSGSRLMFYTKDLTENVRKAVSELAVLSANDLERWSKTDGFKTMSTDERIKLMCKWGFEGFIVL